MVLSNFSQIQGLFQTFSRNTKQSQKSCRFKNFPELLFRMCSLGHKLALKIERGKKNLRRKVRIIFELCVTYKVGMPKVKHITSETNYIRVVSRIAE